MDNFNNDNISSDKDTGSISGFDYASNSESVNFDKPVTDGFYTTPKENIIQDEPRVAYNDSAYETASQNDFESSVPKEEKTYTYYSGYEYSNPYDFNIKKPKREKKKYSGGVVVLACILAVIFGTISGGAVSFIATISFISDGTKT